MLSGPQIQAEFCDFAPRVWLTFGNMLATAAGVNREVEKA
jgi:hypothetical protein